MRRFRFLSVFVLLVAFTAALPAQNKGKDKDDPNLRNLEGVVTDPMGTPVAKAVVQLKDMKTLQVRSFVSSPAGEYRFTGLRKDTDYEVKASHEGLSSDTKRLTVYDSRKIATINLALEKK